jgi:hypothetical protein
MVKRGTGLKLVPNGNTVGRLFPESCQTFVNDSAQTVTLRFGGTGYAWTPVAGRVAFSLNLSVEYRMDFYMAEDAVYVWARTQRIVEGPEFNVISVENKMVDWAARSPVGYLASTFGGQIVASHSAGGCTVVHTDDGDEFTLGQLQPPSRPHKPFDTAPGNRVIYANEITEIRAGQLDFLGPFEVVEGDQALFFRFVEQGPAIDVLIYDRSAGDALRRSVMFGAAGAPPPSSFVPVSSWVVQPGPEQRQKLKLPAGQYVVVVDNGATLATVIPPWNPLNVVGGASAILSYTAELGDAGDAF